MRLRDVAPLLIMIAGIHPASAAIVFTDRLVEYSLSFTRSDFLDANARYDTTVGVTGLAGDSLDISPNILRSTFENFIWTGFGGVNVTHGAPTPGLIQPVPGTISTPAAVSSGGGFILGYDTPVAIGFEDESFAESWIVQDVFSGQPRLLFFSDARGLVQSGVPFDISVIIPGDWSGAKHNLIDFNSAWTIVTDFEFDGVNTQFFATLDNYQQENPNLYFELFGEPVPEPLTVVTILSGLALLCIRRRRTK